MVKEYFKKPPKRGLQGFTSSINEVTNMLEDVETFSDDDDGDEVNANVNVPEMEKGSISSDGRYRSLNARWFGCKVKRSSDPNSSVRVWQRKRL
eukprot:scaffold174575_cov96-Cyclotella_meneghiniana.AAC.1